MTELDSILTDAFEKEIEARMGATKWASDVVRESLTWYYAALKEAIKSIDLRDNESLFLAGLNCGDLITSFSPYGFVANVEHSIRCEPTRARAFDIKAEDLVNKLKRYTTIQIAAVVDALCRFWVLSEKEPGDAR